LCILPFRTWLFSAVKLSAAPFAVLLNARVEVVPGAPHSMYWETPALFNDGVSRLLKEIAAAA